MYKYLDLALRFGILVFVMNDFHFRQGSGIQAIHEHLKIIGDIFCACVIFLQTGSEAFIRHRDLEPEQA